MVNSIVDLMVYLMIYLKTDD